MVVAKIATLLQLYSNFEAVTKYYKVGGMPITETAAMMEGMDEARKRN